MANSVNGTFDIPSGFTLEQIECQLYHEDLNEDDELWLIRMPCDVELSTLDRKKIFLSDNLGDSNIKDIKTASGKLLECYAENCEIPSTCVVLPRKSDGQLHAVKKAFKGTILISEGLALGDDVEIKSENEHEQQENAHNSTRESKGKKSKKKKRQSQFNSDTSELNYETEDAENLNSLDSRKKRSKKHSGAHKKSTSESVEIKDEPMSMDWDGFPPCGSQK